jgi:DNA repair photolyase
LLYEYKNVLSVTSQFSYCGLPFRLDTYSGCEFSCIYCYVHNRGGNSNYNKIKISNPVITINRFNNALNNSQNCTGIITEFIRRKVPLHFGGMSDPFQPLEEKYGVSYKVLEYLCSINYPIVISTKSSLLNSMKYIEILKSNKNLLVQFSFSTLRDDISKIFEPNSPSPKIRLLTIDNLIFNNIKTAIRWQPYIPNFSEDPEEFINKISNIGIKHLSIEFLKIPIDNNFKLHIKSNPLLKIKNEYRKLGALVQGRELILHPKYKILIINKIIKLVKNKSFTFGVADNEINYLSNTICCCGIDKIIGFENWYKYQFSYALKTSNNNLIKFDALKKQWKPKGSIDMYLNSKCRMQKLNTYNKISDYIKTRWEKLDSDFNPTKYFGVLYSGKRDKDNNRIYKFDKKFLKQNNIKQ